MHLDERLKLGSARQLRNGVGQRVLPGQTRVTDYCILDSHAAENGGLVNHIFAHMPAECWQAAPSTATHA